MEQRVILFGATGDLGSRILRNLNSLNGTTRCIVRPGLSPEKRRAIEPYAAEVLEVDFRDLSALSRACQGGTVVVSAVSGLREVIVDLQTQILKAAVEAGVPRFIPSDFSIDYRRIPPGENRNLNLREEFRALLDATPGIRATSVLNGAFMDMLTGVAPFILFPIRRILCWGDPAQLLDWTTIDDTARFTAFAALDDTAPRYLRIAGSEVSANTLAETMTRITGKKHSVLRPGSLNLFKKFIALTKLFVPGKGQLYPPWQGMQYMHAMYSGACKHSALDNSRYDVRFTTVDELLRDFLAGKIGKYIAGE